MEEREFFDERPDKKPANLNCPHCHQSAEYEINWLVRTKKRSLPPRADERDRARFAKASFLHGPQRRCPDVQEHALPQAVRDHERAIGRFSGLSGLARSHLRLACTRGGNCCRSIVQWLALYFLRCPRYSLFGPVILTTFRHTAKLSLHSAPELFIITSLPYIPRSHSEERRLVSEQPPLSGGRSHS